MELEIQLIISDHKLMGIEMKHLCLKGLNLLNVLLPAGDLDLDLLIDLDQLNDLDLFMVVT